jgi:hypothetical protein
VRDRIAAWLLWLRASLLGAVAVPASIVVALGALAAR